MTVWEGMGDGERNNWATNNRASNTNKHYDADSDGGVIAFFFCWEGRGRGKEDWASNNGGEGKP